MVSKISQEFSVKPPDRFIAQAFFYIGIFFKFFQQVIQECAFTASGRPIENIYLVLLDSPLQRFHLSKQPVGKRPVCKEGPVGILYKKSAAIIVKEMNRFRIIRIFVNTLINIIFYHIMKNLEDIPDSCFRLVMQQLNILLKWQ